MGRVMELAVPIPDDLLSELDDPAHLARRLLEAYAAEGYRGRRLSRSQVGRLLDLDYRQTEEFLKNRQAYLSYSLEDLEQDRLALDRLLGPPTAQTPLFHTLQIGH